MSTDTPTRAELKARRSHAMHVDRVANAPTPEAAAMAAIARTRAILARGGEAGAVLARRVVDVLTLVCDEADAEAGKEARR